MTLNNVITSHLRPLYTLKMKMHKVEIHVTACPVRLRLCAKTDYFHACVYLTHLQT